MEQRALDELVARALAEDIGSGDVTTAATVPADARGRAAITQKQPGVISGLDAAEAAFGALDPEVRLERLCEEGVWRDGGDVLAAEGLAAGILAAERTALNFLAHLSGVATLTARCVRELEGTGARLLDTRKTTPGMRLLEKRAVRHGGGHNHRTGLYDAILIKENHIAAAGGIGVAVQRAREAAPDLPLEVECRNLAEIDEALAAGAPRLLLDNMSPAALREAVDHVAGRAELEASGGVTLDTLKDFGGTGVQFISMGALTHSAAALDLSLTFEP